jgi:hypothetical protein
MQNGDVIKSSFMLIEVLFSITHSEAHRLIQEICINLQYGIVEQFMTSLNGEIVSLNEALKED